jgi:hypothetical protein
MNDLGALTKSNLKCGKDYAATQDVARNMPFAEPDLRRKPSASSQQLDFQIEEEYVGSTAQGAYTFSTTIGHIVYSNQLRMLGTEHRVGRTGVEYPYRSRGQITVEEFHLGGGL